MLRVKPRTFKVYDHRHLDRMPWLAGLDATTLRAMKAASAVLPFRTNEYVVEELIRWEDVPHDPIFQLTFPQPGMLDAHDLACMTRLLDAQAGPDVVRAAAREIQRRLNPHPAGQVQLNVPRTRGRPLRGVQHKYRETVLFFPSQGQTCHAYCTYCFRWPQFVGLDDLKFAADESASLSNYLRAQRDVSSVLFTGGDPLIMRTALLRGYVAPLLAPDLAHVTSIRFGTKSTTYWPYRFLTDRDADDLLRLFEEIVKAGKHVALMAHVTHPRELETEAAQAAIARIRATGAVVRCQAPLVRHVNDDAQLWERMWRTETRLGAIPYYMFVERDTGPRNYFEVPLARACAIFQDAYRRVSGLARTVRGPSMSATPGKVVVDGIAHVAGRKVFVLKFLQARDPAWVGVPFFAEYDADATWLDQLRPAFGEPEFFFESGLRDITRARMAADMMRGRAEAVDADRDEAAA